MKKKPTGAPIKVMVEAPVDSQIAPYPNIPAAAKVFAQYINDKDGIKPVAAHGVRPHVAQVLETGRTPPAPSTPGEE